MDSYKSGFEPPGDVEFEDYGQAMKRTVSETSLSNSREAKEKPAGKSKGKLWPFIKKQNKVTHECTLNTELLLRWLVVVHQALQEFPHLEGTLHWREVFMGWDGEICVMVHWLSHTRNECVQCYIHSYCYIFSTGYAFSFILCSFCDFC